MSLESSFYTWLLESLPGGDYDRTKVRDIVNDVQNEVLGAYDGRLMKLKPDPYLIVTDATIKRYVANTSIVSSIDGVTTYDIRRVKRVYAFSSKKQAFGSYNNFGNGPQPFPPFKRNPGSQEIEMPIESPLDSVRPLAGDCLLDFYRDFSPTVSINVYNVEAWEWPLQLTSESVAIRFPIQFRKTVLLFGVLSKIETRDFGRDDTIAQKFDKSKSDWYKYDENGKDFGELRSLPRWA